MNVRFRLPVRPQAGGPSNAVFTKTLAWPAGMSLPTAGDQLSLTPFPAAPAIVARAILAPQTPAAEIQLRPVVAGQAARTALVNDGWTQR